MLADDLTRALAADHDNAVATPPAPPALAGPPALAALVDAEPEDRRDRIRTLLRIYPLHTAPVRRVGPAARHQHHPAVAAIKGRCEATWLAELGTPHPDDASRPSASPADEADDPVTALRGLAARTRLPAAYHWLAAEADRGQLEHFLALEGGPDGAFDDLVAACQVGLHGAAKVELARNYWDEMGGGDPEGVHTTLHDRLVAAVDLPTLTDEEQPTAALERSALGGLLATNRWLQPEMLGALGLIELQAGPRSRQVLRAFDRLGVAASAYPFYEVHADVDPRHGQDWLDNAIAPLVREQPEWGPRIVAGAHWRARVDAAFFAEVEQRLVQPARAA